jgi:Mn-dependent DtxR family transcriptional regulator
MSDANNAAGVWKTFDENAITHSAAHHLLAIHELLTRHGYARVTDVAKYLNISRGSASVTLKALKGRGYVAEDDNKFLQLTAAGKQIVQMVAANRRVLIEFLRDVLAVSAEQAEIDACKVEHLFSTETGERFVHFLDFLFSKEKSAAAFLAAYQAASRSVFKKPSDFSHA